MSKKLEELEWRYQEWIDSDWVEPDEALGEEGVMATRISCSRCGRPVCGALIPSGSLIRAFIECPECIEKQPDYEAEVQRLRARVADLDRALRDAVDVIRCWHNFPEGASQVWDIYYNNSPEMARIRATLGEEKDE